MTKDQSLEPANFIQLPSLSAPHASKKMPREGEFICGWGAAFINICVTFPINKAIFRQQLHGISGFGAVHQLKKDGIRFLYRGLLPPLLQKTSSLSIMFGGYYWSQDFLQEKFPALGVKTNHTVAALAAGTFEAVFTPFERIQTLMQTAKYHDKFSNTLDAFKSLKSYGLREYYRGLCVILLRNGPSNVSFFLGREYLQTVGPTLLTGTERMVKDFICGACLGAVISTVFFPLNVLKAKAQCKLGGDFDGVWNLFKVLLAERNGSIKAIFKGVHLNYMRSFISWGIINASYEFLMTSFFKDPQGDLKNR
ncbi:mitochondrial nicotinamide adenine dinucleotide transporter SLC25A51-like [Physella acuta]|uniref:mitochondrial nicotinamide adenine dinucleotide transporter SLC25A51-like n=1 Tax=Physella acuta TaxID=109671 RepID=UPI0027DCABAE|nr:mitochondrial nicotinamide adenine dinucleotide transporter SLC25A51-like [Physella acuta]XP_059174396.1 mitochondrial nicotinamide adenine dinucleotide transporter SLC25A51-like [Physella acuta]